MHSKVKENCTKPSAWMKDKAYLIEETIALRWKQKPTSQKSSMAFNPPNLKIPGLDAQPRIATSGHKFPTICRFLIQICANLRNIFTKPVPPLDPSASDLQNLKISGPKVLPRAATSPTRSHYLSNDSWPSPSNLCKSTHNFRKLTIPWSSTALDWHNPKKFETKKAVTCCHAPPTSPAFITSNSRADARHLHHITRSHAPRASTCYTLTRASVVWRHGWHQPTRFDRPGNLTRIRTA